MEQMELSVGILVLNIYCKEPVLQKSAKHCNKQYSEVLSKMFGNANAIFIGNDKTNIYKYHCTFNAFFLLLENKNASQSVFC